MEELKTADEPEITVKIPKIKTDKKKVPVKDESKFRQDVISFVNDLENRDVFNKSLYDKILKYGADQKTLDQMVERIKVFSSYDDDKTDIGFPYENWIPRLLEFYTEEIK